jgi:hypothetical protein
MQNTPQSDADFFAMVHTMRREARMWASGADRRTAERHTFPCRQWIAVYDARRDDHERNFREVDCQDLSTGGFSFLVPEIPEAEQLCVRLGAPGKFVYLTAQMVSCRPIDTDGGPGFLIGCRFTGRTNGAEAGVLEAATV